MMPPISPTSGIPDFFASMFEFTMVKALLSGAVTYLCAFFGGDPLIVWLLFFCMIADFGFGVFDAVRRGRFKCRELERGALKFVYYSVYLGIVGVVNVSVSHTFGYEFLIFNFFVTYLILTEAVSILAHMRSLGIPVPSLLLNFVLRSRKHAEHTLNAVIRHEDEKDFTKKHLN